MIPNFNSQVIRNYSPISYKGGRRRKNRKNRTRKYKRSNKSRTRRHY